MLVGVGFGVAFGKWGFRAINVRDKRCKGGDAFAMAGLGALASGGWAGGRGRGKGGARIPHAAAATWQMVQILCADQLIDRPCASSCQMSQILCTDQLVDRPFASRWQMFQIRCASPVIERPCASSCQMSQVLCTYQLVDRLFASSWQMFQSRCASPVIDRSFAPDKQRGGFARASTIAGVRGGGAEKRGKMILHAVACSWQAVRVLCADQLIDRLCASSSPRAFQNMG